MSRNHPLSDRAAIGERGNALILAMFFVVVAASLVFVGALSTDTMRDRTTTQFRLRSQASQFARSGLTEAISWFRRQTTQPVTAFAPSNDLLASPPRIDTDEPDIGLVREFRIEGRIWGRYEIWKPWSADPVPGRVPLRNALQALDVSTERTFGPGGTAWRLRAVGYVFDRRNEALGFDTAPNHVLARQVFEAEILRLRLSPPGAAALSIRDGSAVTIRANARVDGGTTGAGVYSKNGTGSPSVAGVLTGSPGFSSDANYSCSTETVFGVSERDLVTTADLVVESSQDLPSTLPANALVVIDAGNITFDSTHPLRGSAVVYVRGDVTIAAGSASSFSGLLYVAGNLRITAPADVDGSIVVADGHTAELIGTGDWVRVAYDSEILDHLRREIGQYRITGPIRGLDPRD
ncbi:MAG: hypothetical protein HZB39_18985 [Planctomycetes bacterium]|nr:hypothetical protein [Planctomycetota bacterium]